MRVIGLRYFNVFGPRQDPNSQYSGVIARFITALLQGNSPVVYGDGEQTRSFCYVSDLIDVILKMMNKDDFIGPVNIGNPGEFTIRELAEKILKLTGSRSKIQVRQERSDDPVRRRPDISLAREKLGWEPSVDLEEGLGKTIELSLIHI